MNELYIEVIDSIIKVVFESDKTSTARRNIERMYGGYIVNNPGNHAPAYTLFVHDNYEYTFLRRNGKAFISFFEEKQNGRIDLPNTADSIQLDLLMRIIIHDLARKKDMFILHTSAVLVNGMARVFIGRNGIGKSTIVKMLKHDFPPLCDDKIIVKKEKNRLFLYQVPYRETNNFKKSNSRYPIGGFYVLKQDVKMDIRKIDLRREHDFIARFCSEVCVDDNRQDIVKLAFSLKDNLFELGFTLKKQTEPHTVFPGIRIHKKLREPLFFHFHDAVIGVAYFLADDHVAFVYDHPVAFLQVFRTHGLEHLFGVGRFEVCLESLGGKGEIDRTLFGLHGRPHGVRFDHQVREASFGLVDDKVRLPVGLDLAGSGYVLVFLEPRFIVILPCHGTEG